MHLQKLVRGGDASFCKNYFSGLSIGITNTNDLECF